MNDNRRTVKSDETLFNILRVVRDHNGIRLTEIAEEVGLANSTVHSHLLTLQEAGFVDKTGSGYRLGLRFLEYGTVAQKQRELYVVGKDLVDEIANETNEKGWCIVEENGQAVYIHASHGDRSIKTYTNIGHRTGLHHLAAGKVILANLPEERVEEIIDAHGLQRHTEHTITSRDELMAELESVREQGVAYNLEESVLGLHAIGAPVIDDETVHGAISISGPANRLSRERLETELRETIRGFANELEINIRANRDKAPLFEQEKA